MCFTALKAVLKCTCRSRPRARGDQGSLLQGNTLKSFCPHLHLSSKLIKSLQQHSEQLLPQPRPQHSLLQLGHLDCHSLSREVPSCPAPSSSRDGSAHQVHPGCPLLSEAINTSLLLFSPARAAGAGSVAAASPGLLDWLSPHHRNGPALPLGATDPHSAQLPSLCCCCKCCTELTAPSGAGTGPADPRMCNHCHYFYPCSHNFTFPCNVKSLTWLYFEFIHVSLVILLHIYFLPSCTTCKFPPCPCAGSAG